MIDTYKEVLEIVENYRSNPSILRRQGPTFLQLEPTPDVWLHFWGSADKPVGERIAAQAHTHHRDFSSTIVFGALTNTIITMKEPDDPQDGALEEYLLVGGDAMSASDCVPTGRRLATTHTSSVRYAAGDMYDMVADTWHRTLFTEPSITLLHLKGPVVPRYIAWTAGMGEQAKLAWVAVDRNEAMNRINGLLGAARLV